jgi:putative NIF3 family GTP cyclohydrolase 1 type 2
MQGPEFLAHLKSQMQLPIIRHTALPLKPVQRIAVCGGAGVFLLKDAMAQRADVLVTSDFKYHDFFLPEGQLMVADIGHYESEVHTIELITHRLLQQFTDLKVLGTRVMTNPVRYYF